MNDLESQIPGLREAIENEGSAWDAAWLGLNESICGIEVKPYTPRHDLILGWNGLRSPFLGGEFPKTGAEIVRAVQVFIWTVSPHFGNGGWLTRRRLMRRIGKLSAQKVVSGIRRYLNESYSDAPPGVKGATGPSYFSWFAAYCDLFGKEYGWKPEDLRDRPIKQIFQLAKPLRQRNNPDCHLFKPSDRIIGDWLDTQQPIRN